MHWFKWMMIGLNFFIGFMSIAHHSLINRVSLFNDLFTCIYFYLFLNLTFLPSLLACFLLVPTKRPIALIYAMTCLPAYLPTYLKQPTCTYSPTQDYIWDVATPLWGKCEVTIHTFENGTWESFKTPENSERDCRGQNTLHWSIFYTVGKVLKCRCPKCPCMSHLDIYNTSYGRKKGRESNWQFDSQPLKVGNRPNSGACR
jgi:hypothetical protein